MVSKGDQGEEWEPQKRYRISVCQAAESRIPLGQYAATKAILCNTVRVEMCVEKEVSLEGIKRTATTIIT